MAIVSSNPCTGAVIQRFEADDAAVLEAQVAGAARAFDAWRRRDIGHRAVILQEVAQLLRARDRQWASLMTAEMGKPLGQAIAEARKCAWVCDYYAEHAEQFLASRTVATEASASYVRYDPLGVILGVMPWNFPLWQVLRYAAPTLMAGNTTVMKHASNVPRTALALEKLFKEAGAPAGVFTTLLIDGPRCEALIADPRIAAVSLTGSEAVGRRVGAAAGAALKPAVLELGGSDPFIVLRDADVPRAAQVAASARMLNNGQSCIAAKRFIVVRAVAEAFTEAFRAALAAEVMGDPLDEATTLGPMARGDLRAELHDQVERSRAAGARVILGGVLPEGPGYFYPATLLIEVDPSHAVASEETFGPAAAVLVVDDEEQAIALANDSPYGLGASLWTADIQRAHALAGRIEAGAVFVNDLTKSDPRLPFGGIKASGFGRELSQEGLRAFVNTKTVVVA